MNIWRMVLVVAGLLACAQGRSAEKTPALDPAAWGTNHVGKPVPEFMTGGECLFCHRQKIGQHWPRNRHQLTIRPLPENSPAHQALARVMKDNPRDRPTLMMGRDRLVRFLRRNDQYGQLDLHSHSWNPQTPKLSGPTKAGWQADLFGPRCAGCHTTGVDGPTHAFAAVSIDCYACHGPASLDHARDPSQMLFSEKANTPARVIVSICSQCHIRTGKSRSTGRPYPNNFVPGDNLFRDLEVSFTDKAIQALNPGDRHILENARDVVVHGRDDITCLSCHRVHRSASLRHRRLSRKEKICYTCHEVKDDAWLTLQYDVHSTVCGYPKNQ